MPLYLVHVRAEADIYPQGLDARELPGFTVDPCPGMSISEIDLWKEVHEEEQVPSINIRVEMNGVPQEPISEWKNTFEAAVSSTFDLPAFELGLDGFVDAVRETEGTGQLLNSIYTKALDAVPLDHRSTALDPIHQAAMEMAHCFTSVTIESGSIAALAQLPEMARPMAPSCLDPVQWQQAAQQGIEAALNS